MRLERALTRSAAAAGAPLQVESHRIVAWHSATFSGDRHELVASAMSDARLDEWLTHLSTADVTVPGRMLAELRVAECERVGGTTRFTIESVTLEVD